MKQDELKTLFGTSSFKEIELSDMVEHLGEDKVSEILSHFSCPLNKDVEKFLREKAILFSKRDLARTTLVYWVSSDGSSKELVGYYAIADKLIKINHDSLSSKERHKLFGHGDYDPESKLYSLSARLLGQLGKNYSEGNNSLISGDDLLQLAMRKLIKVWSIVGGKIAYLECEDAPALIDFYTRNGFKYFGKRTLDRDETDIKGEYLLQFYTFLDRTIKDHS